MSDKELIDLLDAKRSRGALDHTRWVDILDLQCVSRRELKYIGPSLLKTCIKEALLEALTRRVFPDARLVKCEDYLWEIGGLEGATTTPRAVRVDAWRDAALIARLKIRRCHHSP